MGDWGLFIVPSATYYSWKGWKSLWCKLCRQLIRLFEVLFMDPQDKEIKWVFLFVHLSFSLLTNKNLHRLQRITIVKDYLLDYQIFKKKKDFFSTGRNLYFYLIYCREISLIRYKFTSFFQSLELNGYFHFDIIEY